MQNRPARYGFRNDMARREFLKVTGAGALSLPFIAGPFGAAPRDPQALSPDHYVPVRKMLDRKWIDALFAKGAPRVYRGEQRAAVAMPVGGIGTGQIYLGSDGTLRVWAIMNRHVFSGYGRASYEFRIPERVVDHGFALAVQDDDGPLRVRRLREEDVPDVEIVARYPVAEVHYPAGEPTAGPADRFPLAARLQAFSPFIPLNAADSTLPVTIFRLTVENVSQKARRVAVLSWLENVAARFSGDLFGGRRRNEIVNGAFGTWLGCRIDPKETRGGRSEPEVFANFESNDYGSWTASGEAFGKAPSRGTNPGQNPVSGFDGQGLVNTYLPDDSTTGRLTSPRFTIHRRFINFLIGGGDQQQHTCLNLLVDGAAVASATGKNTEQLEWAHFDVTALEGREAVLEIVDQARGAWGHVNVDQVEFSDQPKQGPAGALDGQPDFGELGMIYFEQATSTVSEWPRDHTLAEMLDARGDLRGEAGRGDPLPRGLVSHALEIPAGESRTLEAALVWFFPNHRRGHAYATRFSGARDLAMYIQRYRRRLIEDTLAYHHTYYDSTLPCWLLERIHAPVANLATNTVQYWENGRFWAWEGVGCCTGTCTHVWNYEQALARLFPELARSIREMQDLGEGFHEDGLVGFRSNDAYAADGQAGTVLKLYREHLMSRDGSFLQRNWPKIRRVVEYLIQRDANDDGLIEDAQHNTYDIAFYGANTFVGALYLGALRAAEEMARRAGDDTFAVRCRRIFESGSRLGSERLFNGEYFIQEVDLEKHARWQYANGCLSDQLFGQAWAHQVDLGYLYSQAAVRSALESVYRYNWAPDVGPQNARHLPERYFARRGEAGLFLCTWPHSRHPETQGVRYRNEVWTGIEYQVAAHMIEEGMVREGLAILRGIDERYDGRVMNPFNEVECGDHYARSLASWGCLIALSGLRYDGPAGRLGFAPRLDEEEFRAFFTGAEGWGTLEQERREARQTNTISVRWGRLRLTRIEVELPSEWSKPKSRILVGGKEVAAQVSLGKASPPEPSAGHVRLTADLEDPVVLEQGTALQIITSDMS